MPIARAEPPPSLAPETGYAPPPAGGPVAYVLQMAALISFFTLSLTTSLFCGLLHLLAGRWISPAAGQEIVGAVFRFWLACSTHTGVFDVQFREVEKLRAARGIIIAPNHPSLLDAFILISLVPDTVCIMRADLMKNPFYAGAAQLAGFVANDTGPALIRQGVEKIQQGRNLLIFPEGTRTTDASVNSFKTGFALIAAKSGAPVQTVLIERNGRYLGKGASFLDPAPPPIAYRFHLGEKFTPLAGESAHEFTERLHGYFLGRLENTGKVIRLKQSPR